MISRSNVIKIAAAASTLLFGGVASATSLAPVNENSQLLAICKLSDVKETNCTLNVQKDVRDVTTGSGWVAADNEASALAVNGGDTIQYRIRIANNTGRDVLLVDNFPTGLTLVTPATFGPQIVPAGNHSYTVTANINGSFSGALDNTALVTLKIRDLTFSTSNDADVAVTAVASPSPSPSPSESPSPSATPNTGTTVDQPTTLPDVGGSGALN